MTTETQQVEYKKSFGKEVIISLVAFANSDGGEVYVGIDDTGAVTGVSLHSETIQRYQNEIKVATYPQLFPKIKTEQKNGKDIIIFSIAEHPIKPVSYKNRYYTRLHNSNHLLPLEEIVDLQQQSLSLSFDSYPSPTVLEALDHGIISAFFDRINQRGRILLGDDIPTNLTKLKLIRDGKVTIAANLLFGDPDFSIRIGRFKSAATIIDDNVVKGPLFNMVDEAMIFIKKHINLEYHFDGSIQRIERWQYPIGALRELLLNCIVHRDYKNFSDIVIKIFDDHIVFTNPGCLYGKLCLEDLERDDYTSSIRNKLLAEAFYLTGDIEKFGTGFVRIRKYLREYPEISTSFEEMGDFFMAALRLERETNTSPAPLVTGHVTGHVTGQVTGQVTKEIEKIVKVCQGELSRLELQQRLHLKHRDNFTDKYLNPALRDGLMERTIPDKPKSKLQKYRLTNLGKQWLAEQGQS